MPILCSGKVAATGALEVHVGRMQALFVDVVQSCGVNFECCCWLGSAECFHGQEAFKGGARNIGMSSTTGPTGKARNAGRDCASIRACWTCTSEAGPLLV